MGGAESSNGEIESKVCLENPDGCKRSECLSELAASHLQDQGQDFYEIFGLARYCDLDDEENNSKMKSEFSKLVRSYHPDKNMQIESDVHKRTVNEQTCTVITARDVLRDPDLKRRYDNELRKARGEVTWWSHCSYWARVGILSSLLAVGGLSLAIGLSLPSVVAVTMLASGIWGSRAMHMDPDCSDSQFIKSLTVGAAMGAMTGAIGVFTAGAKASCVCIMTKVGFGAGQGSVQASSSMAISDAADYIITTGWLGSQTSKIILDAKTPQMIFSTNNARTWFLTALAGAAVGGVVTAGHEAFICGHGSGSESIADAGQVCL